MREIAIKSGILQQFRGRLTAWIVASLVSSIVVAGGFFVFRDTCDLTAVRLKVEENQLVDVFGRIGVRVDGLKGA